LPVVHPIAPEAWPLIASRHALRHHADAPCGGQPAAARSPLRWILDWLRLGGSRLAGHRPGPAVKGRPAALRDGSKVRMRHAQPADAPLLADGFARLSSRSRQMRFLTGKRQLSGAGLRYFTDVDHHDHEALGALNQADGRGVGIARYIRDADDPHAAEIPVTIVDDWHGRGLGTELLTRLSARARCAGIRRFPALVAADTVAVGGLLGKAGGNLVRRESATAEYEITLVPRNNPDHTSCRAGETRRGGPRQAPPDQKQGSDPRESVRCSPSRNPCRPRWWRRASESCPVRWLPGLALALGAQLMIILG